MVFLWFPLFSTFSTKPNLRCRSCRMTMCPPQQRRPPALRLRAWKKCSFKAQTWMGTGRIQDGHTLDNCLLNYVYILQCLMKDMCIYCIFAQLLLINLIMKDISVNTIKYLSLYNMYLYLVDLYIRIYLCTVHCYMLDLLAPWTWFFRSRWWEVATRRSVIRCQWRWGADDPQWLIFGLKLPPDDMCSHDMPWY